MELQATLFKAEETFIVDQCQSPSLADSYEHFEVIRMQM